MDNRVNLVFLSVYWALPHTKEEGFCKKLCGTEIKFLMNIYCPKFNQKSKVVERLDSYGMTPIYDFLSNWMIFFHLSSTWLSDLYATKNRVFCFFQFFKFLNYEEINLKQQFIIKSGYYIVPK